MYVKFKKIFHRYLMKYPAKTQNLTVFTRKLHKKKLFIWYLSAFCSPKMLTYYYYDFPFTW